MNERYAKLTLAWTFSLLLAACATTRSAREAQIPAPVPTPAKESATEAGTKGAAERPPEQSRLYKGTGVLVAGQEEGGDVPPIQKPPPAQGSAVTLNFEAADIREVVRNILGDILNESYTIDPAVGGTVTIRTTSGIPRESLHATMEMLLRMNGATMTRERGVWKILPAAAAARIILSGTELELKHLYETIDMFDVNWLAGMSVGLFTLQSAEVKTLMADLDKALGTPDKSPLAGILRIIPIERMNALLVVTPQPEYLDEAKKWIERLDRAGGEGTAIRFLPSRRSR